MGSGGGKGGSKSKPSAEYSAYKKATKAAGGTVLSEADYYSNKFKTEQAKTKAELEASLAKQRKEFEERTAKLKLETEAKATADREAELARREEERVNQGRTRRDELFTAYQDTATGASDFVGREISQEQAKAKLLGVDFKVTDEQRTNRINDYFSTVWSVGQDTQLKELIAEFGAPANFQGFNVTRGTGQGYVKPPRGKETVVGSSQGQRKNSTLLTEDTDVLGG